MRNDRDPCDCRVLTICKNIKYTEHLISGFFFDCSLIAHYKGQRDTLCVILVFDSLLLGLVGFYSESFKIYSRFYGKPKDINVLYHI